MMRFLGVCFILVAIWGCRADMDPVPTEQVSYTINEDDRYRLERNYPKTLEKIDDHKPLSLQDIKNLTRSGVSDSVIIHEIQATRSIYFLKPEDVDELKHAGVSEKVITHMIHTGQTHY